MKLRHFLGALAVSACVAGGAAAISVGNGLVRTAVDASLKAGAVEATNAAQGWIVDANRVWSTNVVRRYNRSFVRWPSAWTSTAITFDAACTPQVFSDGQFAVVVDGVVATTVTPTFDTVPRTYTVTGLTIAGGGSRVEVFEPWNGKPSTQNQGTDGPVESCIVSGVWLPVGATLTKPTATTAIIIVGDSIIGAVLGSNPEGMGSVAGKLTLLGEAKGWIVATLDYGGATQRGDGYTAANLATWIQSSATSMGSPSTVYVVFAYGHNDWADYGATVSSTPTQIKNDTQTTIDALPGAWTKVVVTVWPALSAGANGGGFTIANYRTSQALVTGATIVDSTACGINTTTDMTDGIHLNAGGVTKGVTCLQGSVGLP